MSAPARHCAGCGHVEMLHMNRTDDCVRPACKCDAFAPPAPASPVPAPPDLFAELTLASKQFEELPEHTRPVVTDPRPVPAPPRPTPHFFGDLHAHDEPYGVDREGTVWMIVATRADYTGITSIGIQRLMDTLGPIVPFDPAAWLAGQ